CVPERVERILKSRSIVPLDYDAAVFTVILDLDRPHQRCSHPRYAPPKNTKIAIASPSFSMSEAAFFTIVKTSTATSAIPNPIHGRGALSQRARWKSRPWPGVRPNQAQVRAPDLARGADRSAGRRLVRERRCDHRLRARRLCGARVRGLRDRRPPEARSARRR